MPWHSGKVIKTYREHDVLMGKVDFSGVVKQVCLEHVPQVRSGNMCWCMWALRFP